MSSVWSEPSTAVRKPRTVPRAALLLFSCLVALSLAGCRPEQQREPAAAAGQTSASRPPAGVAAANPMAVEAGLEVLRAGGGAVDAAVAVQATLGLVEPQSSGIAGGAFMLYFDAASGKITAFNGRETAPRGAAGDMFIGEDGKPLGYRDAVLSGRSTGVPGVLPMLGAAHAKFGRLDWSGLFGRAIRLADEGFVVPQRLARYANSEFPQARLPDARALFSRPDGSPVQAGDRLRNPAYAESLRLVAERGPRALLGEPFAAAIVARTRAEPGPGSLGVADLAAYEPKVSEPLCRPYRVYVLCVPPPPSSGVSLLQMLAMLEHTDIAERGPADPQAWYLFAEASRLMYADRDRYVADPDFVEVPVDELLDPGYVAERARLIGPKAGAAPEPGQPPGFPRGPDATREPAGTSHFVVVDQWGNVASMTTTVESLFGSGRSVGGFMLNNQLTDFSFAPLVDGRPVANAVAPGKRPRSSMSPVIILDADGRFFGALGSPGGSAILAYNAKTLVGLLAWGLPLQQAIDLPNLYARGENFYGEEKKFTAEVLAGMADRGAAIKSGRGEESGLHGIAMGGDGTFEGAADPRREGVWRSMETADPAQRR